MPYCNPRLHRDCMIDLSVRLGPLALRNPVLSGSGTYGHGLEMCHFTPPERLGAWVSKTVTLKPRAGNPAPRISETAAGLLNSIGLENRGLEHYLEHTLPDMAGTPTMPSRVKSERKSAAEPGGPSCSRRPASCRG